MKDKKSLFSKLLILFLLSVLSSQLTAQSQDSSVIQEAHGSETGQTVSDDTSSESKSTAAYSDINLGKWDFFFTLDPCIYMNADDKSAPSPIMFSGGLGLDFFNDKAVSFQPKLSFFTNYFLWNGNNARPAEVENRTAQVLNFLIDLDAVHTWLFKNSALQAGGGISVLARFAFLANGVNSSDSGGTDTSTAGDDVSSINSWFYSNLNFLYPNLNISWMRKMESQWIAGFEGRFYFPLGALTDGRGFDTMMISLGVKVQKNFKGR